MTRIMIGAYWGPRQESIGECAGRLHRFLDALGAFDDRLATWYQRGRSRPRPEDLVDPNDLARLTALLDRGRNRRDDGGEAIDDLGFQVGLWNGNGDYQDQASLSVKCGLYWKSEHETASQSNAVVLDLPENLGDLSDANNMTELVSAVAKAWQPDWAGAMSKQAMFARDFDGRQPFVDWIVYVPWDVDGTALPAGQIVPVQGGTVLIAQPDPPDGEDTQEASRRKPVEALIQSAWPTGSR